MTTKDKDTVVTFRRRRQLVYSNDGYVEDEVPEDDRPTAGQIGWHANVISVLLLMLQVEVAVLFVLLVHHLGRLEMLLKTLGVE